MATALIANHTAHRFKQLDIEDVDVRTRLDQGWVDRVADSPADAFAAAGTRDNSTDNNYYNFNLGVQGTIGTIDI